MLHVTTWNLLSTAKKKHFLGVGGVSTPCVRPCILSYFTRLFLTTNKLWQTANTSCFLMYEIAKKPDLQKHLVHEVTSVVGDKTHPSWEDLQKMALLRNCVKETMRLYPPTLFAGRILAEDAVVLGYQIPAGVSYHFKTYRAFSISTVI